MLLISELPVFLLLAPTNYRGIAVTLLLTGAGCFLARKCKLYKKQTPDRAALLRAILFAIVLGADFTAKWEKSSKAAGIAAALHLSVETFLFALRWLLSAAAVWGALNMIAIGKELLSRIPRHEEEIGEQAFKRRYYLLLSFCALFYFALLGGRYVWADEAYTFAMVKHSYGEIWRITAADVHPPLYYFILKFLIKPFQYSLISAKIVSILPYLFILAFGGAELKKHFGNKVALRFMLLFFLFPFSMGYAIEVRMYSWAAAFVFGNAVFAYRCYYEEKASNWIAFALLGVCSAYTHYFALVSTGIVYGLLFILLLSKKHEKIKPWCFASLLTIILYVPWLKCFADQLIYKVNNEYWISEITLSTVTSYYTAVFGAHTSERMAKYVGFAFLLMLVECIKSKDRLRRNLCLCILSVPVGTIAVGVMASVLVRPVFVIRYVVPAIPLLILFLVFASEGAQREVHLYALSLSLLAGAVACLSVFRTVYSVTENALDQQFVERWEAADCYYVETGSTHIQGVLAYYEPDKPIYAKPDTGNWAAIPYDNMIPPERFSMEEPSVVLLVDVGEKPSETFSAHYQYDYIGQFDECGNQFDTYLLTKK